MRILAGLPIALTVLLSAATCKSTLVPIHSVETGQVCDTGRSTYSGAVCKSGRCEKSICVDACTGPEGADPTVACDGPWR